MFPLKKEKGVVYFILCQIFYIIKNISLLLNTQGDILFEMFT